jgi:hypothetical protein
MQRDPQGTRRNVQFPLESYCSQGILTVTHHKRLNIDMARSIGQAKREFDKAAKEVSTMANTSMGTTQSDT